MLAVSGPLPPDDGRWAYEFKWDGVRSLATTGDGPAGLVSRSGRDISGAYPELAGPGVSTRAVLDGEVVALGPDGRPDFGLLQSRMHVRRSADAVRLATTTPVSYLVFDVLELGGRDTTVLPYDQRRHLLQDLGLGEGPWSVPPSFDGSGGAVQAASRTQGLEGVVAKRRDSRYVPGRRSDCWVKVRNTRRQEVVVGGWKPGEGGREGWIGSLLVGVQDPTAGLVFAGHVGTGFDAATLRLLGQRLGPLRTTVDPFPATGPGAVPREHRRDVVWVRPELVVDVEFHSWTREDRLRHPSYKGLRSDKEAVDVVREP